jgi:hypothetical protein
MICCGVWASAIPVSAQEGILNEVPLSGGAIGAPVARNADGNNPAGCTITISSPPGLLGPPCAFICDNVSTGDSVDYQAACNGTPENTIMVHYGFQDVPYRPGDPICRVFKGMVGDRGASPMLFPKGHPRCGEVSGEPHFRSFDGSRYDLQAAGEFVYAKSIDDDFEVQIRLEPFAGGGGSKTASVVTGVAVQAGANRITVRVKEAEHLRIDGNVVQLVDFERLSLGDAGSFIMRQGMRYSIVLADGTNVHVDRRWHSADLNKGIMNVYVPLSRARDGRMTGLSGDGNGDGVVSDFVTRGGKRLTAPLSVDQLYHEFGDSWRVTPETSLFDYANGKTADSFALRDFPVRHISLDDIPLNDRVRAESRCRNGGVTGEEALSDCIYDVALTGDDIFIDSARSQQFEPEEAPESGPPRIVAPARAFAGHEVKVAIIGPVTRGYWLGFAPEDSANNNQTKSPYSAKVLKGGETEVVLAVPSEPGNYELRYRENGGAATIQVASPFQSVAPELMITAPNNAVAGSDLQVEVSGDVGKHMVVTVVETGSDDLSGGPPLGLKAGASSGGVIRKLPDAPGNYEIRITSPWGNGKVVYARRALRIE